MKPSLPLNRSRQPPPPPPHTDTHHIKRKWVTAAAFPFKKGLCPHLWSEQCLCWLVRVGTWNSQAELQGNPPPTTANTRGVGRLFPLQLPRVGLSEVLCSYPLSQQSRPGAKELKKGKAPQHSQAKATRQSFPGASPSPLLGTLALNTNIVYP